MGFNQLCIKIKNEINVLFVLGGFLSPEVTINNLALGVLFVIIGFLLVLIISG